MEIEKDILSPVRINRLHAQGYSSESDLSLSKMAFGIRFAYRACVALLIAAIATQSIVLFSVMLGITFLGVVLPNHPFDYVYNYLLSNRMKRPPLAARSNQLKFACVIATLLLACIIYLMSTNNSAAALIMAALLVGIAALPSTIDLCIPSLIYNAVFQRRKTNTNNLINP